MTRPKDSWSDQVRIFEAEPLRTAMYLELDVEEVCILKLPCLIVSTILKLCLIEKDRMVVITANMTFCL